MNWLLFASNLIIPLTFAGVLMHGFSKKIAVYDSFVEGAKDGFKTILNIMPTIIGLMVAVGMLRASGALELLGTLVSPLTERIGYPSEAVPLTLMRLVSSSAATGLLLDIFEINGPDSPLGRFVSVMMSCTETVFYTMSVYFMSVKITKTRFTLGGALVANFVGVVASLVITRKVF